MSNGQPRRPSIRAIVLDAITKHPGITLDDIVVYLRSKRGKGTKAQVRASISHLRAEMEHADPQWPIVEAGRYWRSCDRVDPRRKTKDEPSVSDMVLAAIARTPGISASDLVDHLTILRGKSSARQVRNSVMYLRRAYDEDSPEHPVAYEGGYWRAADLRRRGVVLYVTDAGTLRAAPRAVQQLQHRIKRPRPVTKRKPRKR